jgi:hypothetical protein
MSHALGKIKGGFWYVIVKVLLLPPRQVAGKAKNWARELG